MTRPTTDATDAIDTNEMNEMNEMNDAIGANDAIATNDATGTTDAIDSDATATPSRRCRRRTLLAGAAAAAVGGLAGCLGGDDESAETPDPIALDAGQACDVCGMVIADHHGPNGQTFFDGDYPRGRDGPGWYDSVTELLTDVETAATAGHEPVVTYVTDYAAVEYEVNDRGDDRAITSHVTADSFVDASAAVYVVESGVLGAMGPDLLPFGDPEAAEAFVDAEGGRIVAFDDLTTEFVRSL